MVFIPQQENPSLKPLIWVSEEGDDMSLVHALAEVIDHGAQSLMILSCSANEHSEVFLSPVLKACSVPLCGGVFPSIFFEDRKLERGFIIVGFPFSISVSSYPLIAFTNDLHKSEIWGGDIPVESRDFLVFVDAMASATEVFISRLFERIGGGINVIGGGAGAIDFIQKPCVFSNAGLGVDLALVAQLPIPMHCAVEHGWEILSGPYLVTESKGTNVYTINYQPAFDIYKSLVEGTTDYRFSDNNFFDIAKNFPLGILGINDDILVRDPIQSSNDALFCVGSVPANSMIYILSGNSDRLICAAEKAGSMASKNSLHNSQDSMGLAVVFDCVSRVLYLGEKFSLELAAIRRGLGSQCTIIGALSIGEIANTSRGTINLLNKSIVIGNL